jgi:hypothetical protein
MGFGEADTRAKLIDPALHARGWTEDLIRHEETAGAVEVVDGRPRRRARGRIDYVPPDGGSRNATRRDDRQLMFRVYDYTDATRLFGQGFVTRPSVTVRVSKPGETPPPPPERSGLAALKSLGKPADILRETKARLFAA